MSDAKVRTQATEFMVTAVPEELDELDLDTWAFQLTVARRGPHSWAVIRRGRVWEESSGKWVDEPHPSSRDDEFIARTRYNLNTALSIAERLAPDVTVNGYTIADIIKKASTE